MPIRRIIAIALLALLLAGCQSQAVNITSHLDKSIDFSGYSTVKIETLNEPKHKIISMLDLAIGNKLKEKGYKLSEATDPDLVIVYKASLKRSQKVTLEEIPAKGRIYSRPLLEAVNEAKILVNAFDPKLDKVIWKASTTRDITNVAKESIDEERIKLRIDEIFSSLPAK